MKLKSKNIQINYLKKFLIKLIKLFKTIMKKSKKYKINVLFKILFYIIVNP